jgi:hypothetical protein
MREIHVAGGHVAIVDDADFDLVSQYKWYLTRNGYARTGKSGGVTFRMHRLVSGATGGQQIDHANRDKLDNRRSNLRFCTGSLNNANRPTRNKTGFKGVEVRPRSDTPQYRASCALNGIRCRGPWRSDPALAARDYDSMAIEKFGEFALTNFPTTASHCNALQPSARKEREPNSNKSAPASLPSREGHPRQAQLQVS